MNFVLDHNYSAERKLSPLNKFIKMLLVLVFAISLIGNCIVMAKSDDKKSVDNSSLEKIKDKNRLQSLELFNKVLHLIETQYYREVNTEKLVEGAINGMLETLDPHSNYLDKNVFTKMQEETNGEFGGLGIEVTQKDGLIIVVTPIEDSPAFKSGIKPGDKIVEINHESILGLDLDVVSDKFKGKNNTKIHLGISRDGEDGILNFDILRDTITVKPVKFQLIQKNFAYIRLIQFQKKSGVYIQEALKKLKDESKKDGGLKGIILDLRNNPGGLLDEAVDVASIFLKDGVVVSTEGRNQSQIEKKEVKKNIKEKDTTTPLAILINGSTASASEIVAGAIQDHKRGFIIGTPSFGKGSVQQVAKIDDEKGVKLTIAQYMTPSNKKIQAIGIIPDITIEDTMSSWVNSHKKDQSVLREKDLKNHLTATIETIDEKKIREEEENIQRLEREKKLKALREDKKNQSMPKGDNSSTQNSLSGKQGDKQKDLESFNSPPSPQEDFQVQSAINYLNSLIVLRSMKITE